jgi:hypothetical protein
MEFIVKWRNEITILTKMYSSNLCQNALIKEALVDGDGGGKIWILVN